MLGADSSLLELFLRENPFDVSLSFREQCSSACRILRMEHDTPVPAAFISTLFGVDRGIVRNHTKKYAADLNRIGSHGRLSALPRDETNQNMAMVLQLSKKENHWR
jgi:hypothetical protein